MGIRMSVHCSRVWVSEHPRDGVRRVANSCATPFEETRCVANHGRVHEVKASQDKDSPSLNAEVSLSYH